MELQLGWALDVAPPGRIAVNLNRPGLRRHSVLIAQSGAGKSFALGRLIEEIAAKTLARFVLLDFNGDFIRFSEVDTSVWANPQLLPWLDAKDSAMEFQRRWVNVSFTVLSQRGPQALQLSHPLAKMQAFQLNWERLSPNSLAVLMGIDARTNPEESNLVREVDRLAREIPPSPEHRPFSRYTRAAYSVSSVVQGLDPGKITDSLWIVPSAYRSWFSTAAVIRHVSRAEILFRLPIWAEGDAPSIIDHILPKNRGSQILVLDLSSLNSWHEQLIVTYSVLQTLWERAAEEWSEAMMNPTREDVRVPTFIVIDEAHNLAAPLVQGELQTAVSESLQRVAAEGRKYALYLLLATQRPAKLHPGILTECDNLLLMRMTNFRDLELVEGALGYVPRGSTARALHFKTGQALAVGEFAGVPIAVHVAPRRTMEGGRNVKDDVWLRDPLTV